MSEEKYKLSRLITYLYETMNGELARDYAELDGENIELLLKEFEEKDKEIERLNNIINELEKLELYEFTPDYDYDENLVEGYTPFNIRKYIQELKGSE